MEGYEVITSDESKAGHVVEVQGDNLIVEHGTIFKARHALPLTLAEADDAEHVVRASVSKEVLESSPKLENGRVDERAVAEHYGLAAGIDAPPTQGAGDLVADDPAWGADRDQERVGLERAEEQRARIRSDQEPGEGPLDSISSPGLTGGDRARDAKP
jgi:hypothetical protein